MYKKHKHTSYIKKNVHNLDIRQENGLKNY